MEAAKRTFLKWLARIGWGTMVAILVGIFLEVGVVIDKPFFFSRLFALLGLVSTVLTLGLWFERSRTRNVIPAEEAYRLGIQFGAKWASRQGVSTDLSDDKLSHFLQQPINAHGQQDSPPIIWPPR